MEEGVVDGYELAAEGCHSSCRKEFVGEQISTEDRFRLRPAIPRIEPLECSQESQRQGPGFGQVSSEIFIEEYESTYHHWRRHEEHSSGHQGIYQIFFRLLEAFFQEAFFLRFHGQGNIQESISYKVEPDNLGRQERQGKSEEYGRGDDKELSNAGGYKIEDYLFNVFVYAAAFFYGGDNGAEVVIE